MRQVNRDELIYTIANALRSVTPATWKLVTDTRQDVKTRGRAMVATTLADKLARLEILTNAPPPLSDQTFSRPLANMLGGSGETGAPTVD